MTRRIGTAEAKAKLSELIGSVAYGHERVLIERRGRPVAALVGIDDVARLDNADDVAVEPRGALALVGGWSELDDELMDQFVSDIYDSRSRDTDRTVDLEP